MMTEYDNDQAAYADFQDNVEAVRKKHAWPAIAWPAFSAPSPPSPPSALPKPAAVAAAAIPPEQVQVMLKDVYAAIAAEKQAKVDADWAAIADRRNKSASLKPRSDALATASPRWPSEADASWAAIATKTNQEKNLKPRNVAHRAGA